MPELKLYPSQGALIKGGLFCVFQLFIGRAIIHVGINENKIILMVGVAWMLVFVYILVKMGLAYFQQKPTFHGDREGFSIFGKAKRPWSDYHGARVKTVRVSFIPVIGWVAVKTGAGFFGGEQQIQIGFLSDRPKKMAEQMNNFAAIQIKAGR